MSVGSVTQQLQAATKWLLWNSTENKLLVSMLYGYTLHWVLSAVLSAARSMSCPLCLTFVLSAVSSITTTWVQELNGDASTT